MISWMMKIPLSLPAISEEDIQAVVSVLRSPNLSLGPKLEEFEQKMAAFTGTKYAVAVNSGTSALHLCVRALHIGEGDEVITTPFSFVASANCMLFERAVPVFVDCEANTYCIDPAKVEAAITPKTKAILAVDVFGYIADWEALRTIAKKHNLALIEDSCEALGSVRGGQKAGTFADAATFAFYPNKQMTTGEGGILVTDRKDIADLARSMRNQGRAIDSTWLSHERLGYNYRLSDINCALGISQLAQLPNFIQKRQQVWEWYAAELASCEGITAMQPQSGVQASWFVYVATLSDNYTAEQRDALMTFLKNEGIGCNNYFPPIHLQPLYRERGGKAGQFPVTETVSDHSIALPFHTNLTQEEVAIVCKMLKNGVQQQFSAHPL